MHSKRNRQTHVLLFAGTGEGVSIAMALMHAGRRVSVSVVTAAAARAYSELPLEDLHVGPFLSEDALCRYCAAMAVTLVVDATHPFALRISSQLRTVCATQGLALLRFERPDHAVDVGSLLGRVEDLADCALGGHRLLLAVGVRQLAAASHAARLAGAVVHARVLPTADAIRQAGAAGLGGEQLAVLRPRTGERPGGLEAALCRRWRITDVLCRQSGGAADELWSRLARDRSIRLWKLKRPFQSQDVDVVHTLNQLRCYLNDPGNALATRAHNGGGSPQG